MHSRTIERPSLTLLASSLGFVLVILDVTVVNVALERIQASFATGVTALQWVVNAYTLTFASLLLTAGALSDRLGAKSVFIAGFGLFVAASLACGAAVSVTMLVTARIVQGIGAALCVPSSLSLLNASFPDAASRARAVAIWSSAGGLAIAAGPVVGGILVDRLGWPSIFFLNLPVGLLGIWLTVAYAPASSRSLGRKLDLSGQITATFALAALTVAIVEGGSFGWTHPLIVFGFVAFVVLAIVFLVIESRTDEPMLPLVLFRAVPVSVSCLVGLLVNFSFYGLMFVLSLYFQSAKAYSPTETGLAFLPMTALITVTNLVAGWLTARFGPKLPLAIGQAIAACGYFALTLVDPATPYSVIVGPLLAAGIGSALTVPAMTTVVLANTEKKYAGVASGALNAARQLGAVIGVGVFGSLVTGESSRLSSGIHTSLVLAGIAILGGCLLCLLSARFASAE